MANFKALFLRLFKVSTKQARYVTCIFGQLMLAISFFNERHIYLYIFFYINKYICESRLQRYYTACLGDFTNHNLIFFSCMQF